MVALGFGEIFGSLTMGIILDKKGNKFGTVIILGIIIVMIPITLLHIYLSKYGVLTFVMTFMWGYMDSSANTHSY
jgi:predicted MFS family arabinose efflux permease